MRVVKLLARLGEASDPSALRSPAVLAFRHHVRDPSANPCAKFPFDVKVTWTYAGRLATDLAPTLGRFLRDYVSGYEELEALLVLANEPERDWSVSAIADSLNLPTDITRVALERLVSVGGLIEAAQSASRKTFKFSPERAELRERVGELARAYREQRMDVVQAMTTNAVERARSTAARYLADAFLFERRKK